MKNPQQKLIKNTEFNSKPVARRLSKLYYRSYYSSVSVVTFVWRTLKAISCWISRHGSTEFWCCNTCWNILHWSLDPAAVRFDGRYRGRRRYNSPHRCWWRIFGVLWIQVTFILDILIRTLIRWTCWEMEMNLREVWSLQKSRLSWWPLRWGPNFMSTCPGLTPI